MTHGPSGEPPALCSRCRAEPIAPPPSDGAAQPKMVPTDWGRRCITGYLVTLFYGETRCRCVEGHEDCAHMDGGVCHRAEPPVCDAFSSKGCLWPYPRRFVEGWKPSWAR